MLAGSDAEIKKSKKNRRYSAAFKRQVVRETLAPGSSVSIVARRHDINSNIVFRWRKEFRDMEHGRIVRAKKDKREPGLVEVGLVDNAAAVRMLPASGKADSENARPVSLPAEVNAPGVIEIETSRGVKLRVSGRVDHRTLSSVLTAIRRLS